eukprot:4141226-Amphidinium_carterae.1
MGLVASLGWLRELVGSVAVITESFLECFVAISLLMMGMSALCVTELVVHYRFDPGQALVLFLLTGSAAPAEWIFAKC